MNLAGVLLFIVAYNISAIGATEVRTDPSNAPPGWQTAAPREEIRPAFSFEPHGGADSNGCFIIQADARDGLDGAWTRTFSVTGGKYYRFSALYQAKSVRLARRSIVAKLDWQDAQGAGVPLDEPTVANYLRGSTGMAETDFPPVSENHPGGWNEVSGTYRAP